MTSFPGSPRVTKGGLVLLNAATGAVLRTIILQYNPTQLSRTLKPQSSGDAGTGARYTGPPIETIKLEAVIDAADQLEQPENNETTAKNGISPQLAALEVILYPPSADIEDNDALAATGALEIIPVRAPLVLFVWGKNRVQPVDLTTLTVIEEAFDPKLNPLRASVSVQMRVINVNDAALDERAGRVFMVYQKNLESLADLRPNSPLTDFGIQGLP